MGKPGMNLQDSFLNQVRKDSAEIMLVLLDGTRLTGYVRGFDNFTVIMSARGSQHLIYKHAIVQIISRRPQHVEGEREAQEGAQARPPEPPLREAPAREGPAPGEDSQGPVGGRRRDERPRNREEKRRHEEAQHKDKFNAIDLSSIKVEQDNQG